MRDSYFKIVVQPGSPDDKELTKKGQPRQRSRSRDFNDSETQSILGRYRSGESARSIGLDYHTNHKRILALVRECGEETRKVSEQFGGLDPAQWSEVTEAYQQGADVAELAERYQVSKATIFKAFRRDVTPFAAPVPMRAGGLIRPLSIAGG
uniref:hypothetical protein n=1 Tax=Cyanobium sp. TaxID=2164130 RepID=UPI0040482E46